MLARGKMFDSAPEGIGYIFLYRIRIKAPMMRNYIVAFADSCYQNPASICPFHQMLLPRTIKDYDDGHK